MLEDGEPDLNEEEDIIMAYIREEHWGYVADNGEDKSAIHSLRWYIYKKYK